MKKLTSILIVLFVGLFCFTAQSQTPVNFRLNNDHVIVTYNSNKQYFLRGQCTASKVGGNVVLTDNGQQTCTWVYASSTFTLGTYVPANIDTLVYYINKDYCKDTTTQTIPFNPTPGTAVTMYNSINIDSTYRTTTTSYTVGGKQGTRFILDYGLNNTTSTDSGTLVLYLQVSDDSVQWYNVNGLSPSTSPVHDYNTTVNRLPNNIVLNGYVNPIIVQYSASSSTLGRLVFSSGYGKYYRVRFRIAGTGGLTTSGLQGGTKPRSLSLVGNCY